ncbi:hypothetical protein [Flagellimonas meridianipacifica]|uniref:Uncharacterized protein n=1 Tax=Flagellimonas meridianipacifica TaxID=1080225 RepID=A0A2T0MA36_9FLAO|nr:hypothetical protein [Allomuricauda pacifica]PRX54396.1 hypothetical protein CLV81_2797 [Allomuricauda pacifica]
MKKSAKLYKPTREEDFISYYLSNSNINFIEQFKVENLKADDKKYRVVDFYLNNLDVYVEYYGLYNSTKEKRKEYDKKTNVYFLNNMPTVLIFPHELGFLDYAFHTKIIKLFKLKKFQDRKLKLYRYLFFRYLNKGKWQYFFITIFWAYLFYVFGWELVKLDESLNAIFVLISIILMCYYGIYFLQNLILFIWRKGVLE